MRGGLPGGRTKSWDKKFTAVPCDKTSQHANPRGRDSVETMGIRSRQPREVLESAIRSRVREAMAVDEQVRIVDAEHMNLLGLLLAGFLQKQLTNPRLARKAKRMRGAYGIRAGRMAITITFAPDGVSVTKGFAEKTRARIFGSMEEMVALVTDGGIISSMIAVLEGRIGIRGNPFALLGLLPIMIKKVKTPPALPAAAAPPAATALPAPTLAASSGSANSPAAPASTTPTGANS